MFESETEYIVELQPRITQRLNELGFTDARQGGVLAHSLAEIASRSRTLDQQALPLFLSLDASRRSSLAELTVALKSHLEAMQDAITDLRAPLTELIDFLAREEPES
jgi:hypothetical protein